MNNALSELLKLAKQDKNIKEKLLDTQKANDPMQAFCDLSTELGFPITIGELIVMGEEYSCNQLKSTNGGGVTPYFGFDDLYDMFFVQLRHIK